MNWIFDTYSNVYNTAMMQDRRVAHHVAAAKQTKSVSTLARLFGRG